MALLTLMERLSPGGRAVYVLREAFSYHHAEIAEILDITESASQQHLHRARRRIGAARGGSGSGSGGGGVDPAAARRIVEEFLDASVSCRTERLVALLTDDATAISDGAGLTAKLLRYDTPQRIAAVARAGFTPTPAKRRLAGGSSAVHHALGQNRESLGLSGKESFDIEGLSAGLEPKQKVTVRVRDERGKENSFQVVVRVDTPEEVTYYRHGGILPYVLRQML